MTTIFCLLTALSSRLHGFPVEWQYVPPDVRLEPKRKLVPACRAGRREEILQRRHLAVGGHHCNCLQYCGCGSGVCLCLLDFRMCKGTAWPPDEPLHYTQIEL